MVVTKEGKFLFVYKVIPEKTQKKKYLQQTVSCS